MNVFQSLVGGGLAAAVAMVAPAQAQSFDYGITVHNNTAGTIKEFNYSECRLNIWLHNRLAPNQTIPPYGSVRFDMYDGIPDCCRDMRAKFTSGAVRERYGVNVCREASWVISPNDPPVLIDAPAW